MSGVIKSIKRLLPIAKRRMGAKLTEWIGKAFSQEKIVKDVFSRRRNKRVLMCHIPEAFSGELPKYHTNFTECHTIARCFDRLGYSVDCASRAMQGIDYEGYDVLFGINGNAFMGSFGASNGREPLRIFYTVGAQLFYSFATTVDSIKHFHARHGRWMLSAYRYVNSTGMNYYGYHLADEVICLGNTFVKDKYVQEYGGEEKFHFLPAFYFPCAIENRKGDFSTVRRSMLWFGSSGMLHKGLDIAIDFAVANPSFTLHICGGNSAETEFLNYYKGALTGHPNIIYHGFVDIESRKFADIVNSCGILLNPSINEAGAASVLNVLGNTPMLPVYSTGSGLDLSEYGIEVSEVIYDSFREALLTVDKMSLKEFASRANGVHKLVKENYTLEQYEQRMYEIIEKIVNKKR